MKKSFVTTLILAGVLTLLLGWYFAFEKNFRPGFEKKKEQAKHVVQLEQNQIQELIVERAKNLLDSHEDKDKDKAKLKESPVKQAGPPSYEKFHLKKAGSDWSLVEPVEDDADGSTVQSMISTLTSADSEQTVDENPADLEPYGLKTPGLKIRVRKESTAPWIQLNVGKDTPIGYNNYGQIEGTKSVLLLGRSVKTTFDKTLLDVRNKKFVKLSRPDVEEVEIKNQKESILFKKDRSDGWTLARENIPTEPAEWNKTFDSILNLSAKSVVDESGKAIAKYGLSSPYATVNLIAGKDKKVVLYLGKAASKFYAKRADKPAIYEIDKDIFEKLDRPSKDYRSKTLAKFNRFKVSRIKLERATDPVELVKNGSEWKFTSEPNTVVDKDAVESLLTKIQDMKISKYLPESAKQTSAPELTVRLTEKDGEQEKERVALKFGKGQNKEVSVQSSDYAMAVTVKEKDFQDINLTKPNFVKAEPKKPEENKSDSKSPSENKMDAKTPVQITPGKAPEKK